VRAGFLSKNDFCTTRVCVFSRGDFHDHHKTKAGEVNFFLTNWLLVVTLAVLLFLFYSNLYSIRNGVKIALERPSEILSFQRRPTTF
jgi:hypothetical protein